MSAVPAPVGRSDTGDRRRRRLSQVLMVLMSLVAIVAVLGAWASRQLLDTDNWVDTSAELLRQPVVQDAASAYLADQLVSGREIADRLREGLPPSLRPLAAPLAAGAGEVAERAARRLIASGAFQKLWRDTNRLVHRQFVAVVEGDGGVLARQGVVLDLRPELGVLARRIGVTSTPTGNEGRVRVLRGDRLDAVRKGVDLLKTLRWVSAALLVALLVATVAVAPDRARGLFRVGLGLVVSGLALLAARRLGGHEIVSALSADGANDAAAAVTWKVATSMLVEIAGATIVLGIVLALGGWVGGASGWALRVRTFLAPVVDRWPEAAYAAGIVLAVGLAAAGLLPGAGSPLAVAVYVVLAVVGVGVLRRRVLQDAR